MLSVYILILVNNIFISTIAQLDVQLILKSSRVSASVCLLVSMQGVIAWPSLSYNITKTYPPSSYFCRLDCDSLTDPDFLFGGNSANRENLVLIYDPCSTMQIGRPCLLQVMLVKILVNSKSVSVSQTEKYRGARVSFTASSHW